MVTQNVGIVEDDAAIRDSLRLMFGARGIESRCYASAVEFLASADTDELGTLLIDQYMPAMTGIELIELLRSRKIATPMILLTDRSDTQLVDRAKRAGVMTVLHKPFSGSELVGWVRLAFVAGGSERKASAQ